MIEDRISAIGALLVELTTDFERIDFSYDPTHPRIAYHITIYEPVTSGWSDSSFLEAYYEAYAKRRRDRDTTTRSKAIASIRAKYAKLEEEEIRCLQTNNSPKALSTTAEPSGILEKSDPDSSPSTTTNAGPSSSVKTGVKSSNDIEPDPST